MNNRQIQIHKYKNYRDYLKDYYDLQKANDPSFSYKSFSLRSGLKSPNYLQLVIAGKRNLTVENIHQFSRALCLSPGELSYFECLVLANQSREAAQESYYKRKLKTLRQKIQGGIVKSQAISLLEHGKFLGVVASIAGDELGVTKESILALTGLNENELTDILESLLKNKIITVESNNYFLREEQFVLYFKNKVSNRFHRFQEVQLDQSRKALSCSEAKFFSHAFTIEKRNQTAIYEMIRKFLNELSEETNLCKPEKLMQINIQLFPFLQ